jgi:hypothetical protein
MPTTITPETFRYVAFDAERIQRIADELLTALGMGDRELSIVVDETTPLGRTSVELDGDTITMHAESGAFEDTRRPREQSDAATATALGRMLLRVRDRLDGGFGAAPPDGELALAHVAAWEAYTMGRLERLGITVNQQRWRYNFRNRHGFSDVSDEVFDRLWASDPLAWDQLVDLSRTAASTPLGGAAR